MTTRRPIDAFRAEQASFSREAQETRAAVVVEYVELSPRAGLGLIERALTTVDTVSDPTPYGLALERVASSFPGWSGRLARRLLQDGYVEVVHGMWSDESRLAVRESAERVYQKLDIDCQAQEKPYTMTTELMEAQFGPVRAEILEPQTETRREVLVRVAETGQVLEHAVATFDQRGVEAYPEVDQKIRAGDLMGQAFEEAGIAFVRDERTRVWIPLSERRLELFSDGQEYGVFVEAAILVGPDRIPYALNREVYSSALKWP